MLKVGLTGGIASGKSRVEQEFAALGIPVADADAVNRELTARDGIGLRALVETLGPGILSPDGTLDRRRLRARLFSDSALRLHVESVLHPLILDRLKARLDGFHAPYSLAVIPLLAESPASQALVDRVLVVDCSEELQLRRLMSRDGETESQARAVLAAQAPRAARLEAADDILLNEGDEATLRHYVSHLHRFYLELAATGDIRRPGLRLP